MNTKKHLTLCAASILALTSPTVSRAALAGYWGFDTLVNSNTQTNDYTASANIGTLFAGTGGAPTLGLSTKPYLTSYTDNALTFHGYTDRVDIPISTSLSLTNAFTFSVWAKADSLGSYPYMLLFSNDSGGSARQWFIQGDSGGGDQMYMWSDANTAWRKGLGFKVGGSGTANLNWHNYAFVYSGGVVTPYVDGVAKTAQTIGGSPNFPSFTHLIIGGKNQAFTSWEGPIDDVAIFNTALSPTEVGQIYSGTNAAINAVLPVPEPSSLLLLSLGGLGLAFHRKRHSR